MWRRVLFAIGLVALDACDSGAGRHPVVTASTVVPANATIDRVVDGDTVVVRLDSQTVTVRLIGINTPETVKPNSPVECFGPEASARTKELLPNGTPIRVVRDAEARDAYDRLLAYVYRSTDGLFVNVALVADGFAQPFPFEPNTAHREEFVAAARAAEQAGLGLWTACSGA